MVPTYVTEDRYIADSTALQIQLARMQDNATREHESVERLIETEAQTIHRRLDKLIEETRADEQNSRDKVVSVVGDVVKLVVAAIIAIVLAKLGIGGIGNI